MTTTVYADKTTLGLPQVKALSPFPWGAANHLHQHKRFTSMTINSWQQQIHRMALFPVKNYHLQDWANLSITLHVQQTEIDYINWLNRHHENILHGERNTHLHIYWYSHFYLFYLTSDGNLHARVLNWSTCIHREVGRNQKEHGISHHTGKFSETFKVNILTVITFALTKLLNTIEQLSSFFNTECNYH